MSQSAFTGATASTVANRFERLLAGLERWGEWLNPILVKECRQALKSQQFVITFTVLLLASWLWSFCGLAMIGPNARYSFAGPDMFLGYLIILAFPLLVIVPFTAFRSLAAECEDRTFELVAITTLQPRQIVTGKLGSAVAQMIVYLSAVAPCLAFTYLLRGIDIVTILLALAYLVLASLALSVLALLVSTLAREKHWQVVLTVVLVAGLGWMFALSVIASSEMLSGNWLFPHDHEFWAVHSAFGLAYVSYFALVFFAAASQLTFATDNRSTALRVSMLGQFLLFGGWVTGLCMYVKDVSNGSLVEVSFGFVLVSALHWYVMGVFMTLDDPVLSQRVQRSLPRSFLGRMLLSWFYPGPGTGLMLAVCGIVAAFVCGSLLLFWIEPGAWVAIPRLSGTAATNTDLLYVSYSILLLSGYVIFYLGLTKLILDVLRRWIRPGLAIGGLVQIALVLISTVLPLAIQAMYFPQRNYSLLQLSNPFWTVTEAINYRWRSSSSLEIEIAAVLVPTAALVVLLLNLPAVARELRFVRIATPARVQVETGVTVDDPS